MPLPPAQDEADDRCQQAVAVRHHSGANVLTKRRRRASVSNCEREPRRIKVAEKSTARHARRWRLGRRLPNFCRDPSGWRPSMKPSAKRRDLLLASFLATLPFGDKGAAASPIDPAQTIVKLPAELQWKANPNNPPRSSESCLLTGDTTQPGLYFTLVRWWPGSPHTYTSDRFCMAPSGTSWCNSCADVDS